MLSYIVTEFLEGRGELIKGYSIATDVFGKDDDFDPDQNSLVRIHAGRLRRQLRLYYLDTGKDDAITIVIPKGRYVPLISSTPREKNGRVPQGSKRTTVKRPKIAVLPFKNVLEKTEYDHIVTGLALELSEALSKFDDFSVIGLNPEISNGQPDIDYAGQAHEKDIRYLIEGSIEQFDDLLLIRTRVIDIRDNTQIASDKFRFDLEKGNLFNELEKLAHKIASYIGGEFGHINLQRFRGLQNQNPSSSLEQDLILKYYHTAYVLKEEVALDFHRSVFEALEKEPDSAILNAFAGDIYGRIYTLDLTGAEAALEKFEYYLEKAYSLDPTHHRVLCSLVMKLFVFDEKERFMQILEKYKGTFPKSPLKLGALALVACLFSEWKVGLALLDEVFENNVNVPEYFYGLRSSYLYKQRDYEQALVEAKKYYMPGVYWGPFYRAICYAQIGNKSGAKKEIGELLAIRPDFETRGRYLLGIMIKDATMLKHMIEGLQKAGLTLV